MAGKNNILDKPPNCTKNGCADIRPQCKSCGFDRMESERRAWYIRKFGLSRMKNGLYGLRIRRAKHGG